ncbi:MAG: hypothetical protein QF893_05790 [Alphaproteobacteria bacterium]|nr:hypothetical protein [Alphaproteobacteria bacterium]
MATNFDRTAEDLGNIVGLEHVNVRIADMRLATLFYMTGLGLTRDPYLMAGVVNMWVNVGRSQFHLPVGEPQVLRGRVGLVLPDLDGLARRLEAVRGDLDGTAFDFTVAADHVDVSCPWGNRIRCHRPAPRFGSVRLAMPYVELDVPVGSAQGIGDFYREMLCAITQVGERDGAPAARISVGHAQELVFRETEAAPPAYDGHHLQIYVAGFSGPHARLAERGLITEESNQCQYRFQDIVDLASGDVLFTLEHEVRSMTNPLYARPLVNRNPDQTNNEFAPGHEESAWAMPYSG